MNELKLTSPMPPSVNHYLAYRAIMRNGKPLAVSYKPKEVVAFRDNFAEYVKQEVEFQGWDMIPNSTQHFYVDAIFYFPQIDMDANNYWKVLLDAITDTQLIWLDDNVVCERVQRICYDRSNPRIELTIHPVDYIGVFDDASHLDTFVDRCIGCTRYARNCSLLAAARDGRIDNNIVDGVCQKFKEKKVKQPKK